MNRFNMTNKANIYIYIILYYNKNKFSNQNLNNFKVSLKKWSGLAALLANTDKMYDGDTYKYFSQKI